MHLRPERVRLAASCWVCSVVVFMISGIAELTVSGIINIDHEKRLLLHLATLSEHSTLSLFRLICLALAVVGAGKLLVLAALVVANLQRRPSCCCKLVYIGAVVTCVVTQLVAVTVSLHQLNIMQNQLTSTLTRAVTRLYGTPGHSEVSLGVDLMQFKFQCCGIDSAQDYTDSAWRSDEIGGALMKVPLTCCTPDLLRSASHVDMTPRNISACQHALTSVSSAEVHQKGCVNSLFNWITELHTMGISMTLIVTCVDLLCLLVACCCAFPHKNSSTTQKTTS